MSADRQRKDGAMQGPPGGKILPTHIGSSGQKTDVTEAEQRFLKTYQSWAVIKKIQVMPLDLTIECQELPNVAPLGGLFAKISPFAIVYARPGGSTDENAWVELGKTEVIRDELNPKFVDSISIRCEQATDSERELLIDIYAANHKEELSNLAKHKLIGTVRTTLKALIDAPAQCLSIEISDPKQGKGKARDRGTCILQLDTIALEDEPKKVTLEVTVDPQGCSGGKKVFMVISRALRKNHWARVYKSETLKNEAFEVMDFTLEQLAAGEEERAFRIELFRDAPLHMLGQDLFGTQRLLGFAQMNVAKLKTMKAEQTLQWWSADEGLLPGGITMVKNEMKGKNHYFFSFDITA